MNKGTYGHFGGILHASLHGLFTMACLWWYAPLACIWLGFFDAIVHYHVDWIKMNYGNRDISTPAFWNHLGLDQMAHQLTYLLIVYMMVV